MSYSFIKIEKLKKLCESIFEKYGFTKQDATFIIDVLLTADMFGIESHGVQRMVRYADALEKGHIDPKASTETVFETPCSAVWKADRTMGQLVARDGMELAIRKAKEHGFGIVTVRGSNHYGIAGYYTLMAEKEDLLGVCMTNTEAIAIPTNGKKAMLGTSPIALCMPADPIPFWYDAATTVITRGKLEVYRKAGNSLPSGWAADENGKSCDDADRALQAIINKTGGGIFPLGGESEVLGSHKGYGLGIIVELFTSIFSGGTTSPNVLNNGNADTSFCFAAIDYGMFGDKTEIRARMSTLLRELRESPTAEGCDRVYTHGEKEWQSRERIIKTGVPVQDKTICELKQIALRRGIEIKDDVFGSGDE